MECTIKKMGNGRGWGECVCVAGDNYDEVFVNSLFSFTVRVFIHWVLATWYFKKHCVNCVFTQLLKIPPHQGRQSPKLWELYANLLFFFDFVSYYIYILLRLLKCCWKTAQICWCSGQQTGRPNSVMTNVKFYMLGKVIQSINILWIAGSFSA